MTFRTLKQDLRFFALVAFQATPTLVPRDIEEQLITLSISLGRWNAGRTPGESRYLCWSLPKVLIAPEAEKLHLGFTILKWRFASTGTLSANGINLLFAFLFGETSHHGYATEC